MAKIDERLAQHLTTAYNKKQCVLLTFNNSGHICVKIFFAKTKQSWWSTVVNVDIKTHH